jgi:hypothetical protein
LGIKQRVHDHTSSMKILLSLLTILITIFAAHSFVAPKSALDTVLETYEHTLSHPVLTLQYGDAISSKQRADLMKIPKRYLSIKKISSDSYYYSVQLSVTKNADPEWEKIRLLQEKFTNTLRIKNADWKISLQGELDSTAKIAVQPAMKQIDVYQDNNSTISSYKTKQLPTYEQLELNLQIAEHSLAGKQKKRITIGYPTLIVEI